MSTPEVPKDGGETAPTPGGEPERRFRFLDPKDANFPAILTSPSVVTVLVAQDSRGSLAKTWRVGADGQPVKVPEKVPFLYRPIAVELEPGRIESLYDLVLALQTKKEMCVVRGAVRESFANAKQIRRLLHPRAGNPRAPEGTAERAGSPAYMRESPFGRDWILLDIDSLRVPAAIDIEKDPEGALNYVRAEMPPPFRDATAVWQWSGSMGIGKTRFTVFKVHLWFRLTTSIKDTELKAWAERDRAAEFIDRALFNPIQIHFTSAPLLDPRIEDPFGPQSGRARLGILRGANDLVDLAPYIRTFKSSSAKSKQTGQNGGVERADTCAATTTPDFLENGAREGERNRSLFAAACDLAGSGVPRDEAEPRLLAAAAKCSPPMNPDEARRTIESAFNAPRQPSRSPKPDLGSLASSNCSPVEFGTEQWFAEEIAGKHCSDVRYVDSWRRFMIYEPASGRWSEDKTRQVARWAQKFAVDDMSEKAAKWNEKRRQRRAAMIERGADEDEDDEGDPKLQAIVEKFQHKQPLVNAIELMKSDPRIIATDDQWDRDPFLFTVANGTIDLRTGALREQRREDYITKRSTIAFDPHARAPLFHSFLERILPNQEVREYLQRALGHGLIGAVREHLLHLFVGRGANGKTTHVELIRHVAGDYAVTAPSSMLIEPRGERHPTEQTILFGRRLVFTSETPEGGKLNENLVKSLTGGDTIIARRMREDFWEYTPTHSWFISSNHLPRITGNDEGIWRRLRLIKFDVTIPPAERDPRLLEKLKAEAPGVLNWLLEGCRVYLARGLEPPDAVLAATAEYRSAEDVLAEFVEQHIHQASGRFLPSSALYERYQFWAAENHVPESRRLSQRGLTEQMAARGFVKARSNAARGFRDIDLRAFAGDDGPGSGAGWALEDARGAASVTHVTQRDAPDSPASRPTSLNGNGVASTRDAVTDDSEYDPVRARTRTRARTRVESQPGNGVTASHASPPPGGAADDGDDGTTDERAAPTPAPPTAPMHEGEL